MRRSSIASFLLLAATAWAAESRSALLGQAASNKAESESLMIFGTPPVKPESRGTKSTREMSPDTAAKLAAATPKFVSPVVIAPGTPAALESSPVLRDADKPRNQVIRLPRFIVGEQKLHVPKEELQVLTQKGRVEYAFKRRPGLLMVPFAPLNGNIALDMLEDDLRAQRRTEQAQLWNFHGLREPYFPVMKEPSATDSPNVQQTKHP